jgi:hypothetical protein
LPLYSALNAIHLPSGENFGLVVAPWKLVMRRATPPVRSTVHTLLAYVNAICDALTDGDRSRRVGAGAADVRTSNADTKRQKPIEYSSRRFISLPPLRIRCRVSFPINGFGNETRHRRPGVLPISGRTRSR